MEMLGGNTFPPKGLLTELYANFSKQREWLALMHQTMGAFLTPLHESKSYFLRFGAGRFFSVYFITHVNSA
jgi:hypothetical protein